MSDETLPSEQQTAKEQFLEYRGFWSSIFDELLFLNPEYVVRYGALSSHPGKVLDRKVKELIHIAVDCSTTHLYHRGTRSHINNAFDHGATIDEIVEVFVLTSSIGLDSVTRGAELLANAEGLNVDVDDDRRAAFADRLGYWHDGFDALLALDPEHFEHYVDLATLPWEEGPLDPKIKYFILLAVAITPTRENSTAAMTHIQNALDAGASVDEILAVVETASVVGVHTMDSMAILTEEAARRGRLPEALADRPDLVTFRDPRYL